MDNFASRIELIYTIASHHQYQKVRSIILILICKRCCRLVTERTNVETEHACVRIQNANEQKEGKK